MKNLLFCFSALCLMLGGYLAIAHLLSKYVISAFPRVDGYYIFGLAVAGILAGFISSKLEGRENFFEIDLFFLTKRLKRR